MALKRVPMAAFLMEKGYVSKDQIDEALNRVDDGTYGTCANCGVVMSDKRLAAVPWTPYCVDCQELSEKGLLEG